MILIYSSPPLDRDRIDNQRNRLKEKLSPFFINDDDFIYSTETNITLLKEMVLNHRLCLFYTYSVKEMGLRPPEISDLITFVLKNGNGGNGVEFQSEKEQLFINTDDCDDVGSMISEIL